MRCLPYKATKINLRHIDISSVVVYRWFHQDSKLVNSFNDQPATKASRSFNDQPSTVSILGPTRVLWWYSQDGKDERNYGKPYHVETDKNDHSAITFVKFSGFVIRDAEELVHVDYKEIWKKLCEEDQRK